MKIRKVMLRAIWHMMKNLSVILLCHMYSCSKRYHKILHIVAKIDKCESYPNLKN